MYDFESKPELNITPLVDVLLVITAILMVLAPTIAYEELVQLPQGSQQKPVNKKSSIEIVIKIDKTVYVQNKKFPLKSFQDNFMLYANTIPKNMTILIQADKRLTYDIVMYVLKSVKLAGFTSVSFATE
jgi:biopolymer transport protein ExbD